MKNLNFTVVLTLALVILLTPLLVLGKGGESTVKPTAAGFVSYNSSSSQNKSENEFKYNSYVRLYNIETEKIEKLELRDYIYGVVAGECPMLYHDEAIKAQIVAAKTYTLYRMRANSGEDYDVTTEPETSQNYIDKKTAHENWGSNAETYDKKLNALIDEVYDYCVLYKDLPILSVYHAMSSGKTEDCKNVWGSSLSYLKPVESEGDKLAEGYLTESSFSLAEANGILAAKGITASELCGGEITRTDSGNVQNIKVGEKEITGSTVTELFGLRSNNFELKLTEKELQISVRGYGHQVGLSQNGANFMAKAGSSFQEILTHYYSGTEVAKYVPKTQ